ncbi:hypothetical protein FQZ97_1179830 [compost metagenome]
MDDGFVFFQAEFLQHAVHTVGAEDAHQVVLKRQEEFRTARIALTTRTSAQLVVDAAALVTFSGKNVKTTGSERLFFQLCDVSLDFDDFCVELRAFRHI